MKRMWTIIGVADVSQSFKWYQSLLVPAGDGSCCQATLKTDPLASLKTDPSVVDVWTV